MRLNIAKLNTITAVHELIQENFLIIFSSLVQVESAEHISWKYFCYEELGIK